MNRFAECPVENESPDPCPKCGATVSGKDVVHGVCQAGVTWDRAEAKERERCAKIAETEGTEYQRQIDQHNKEMKRLYPGGTKIDDDFRERGVYLHAKRSASENIGGLIRLPPADYEAQLAAGMAAMLAEEQTEVKS